MGSEVETCEVEAVVLSCGAACASEVWERTIQNTVEEEVERRMVGWQGNGLRTPSRQGLEVGANISERGLRYGMGR